MLKNYLRHLDTVRVGEILVKKGLINDTILEDAIRTQQQTAQKLGEILVQQGHITRRQLNAVLQQQQIMKTVAMLLLASGASTIPSAQLLSSDSDLRPTTVSQQTHGESIVGGLVYKDGVTKDSQQPKSPEEITAVPQFLRVALTEQKTPTTDEPLIGFCHPMNGKGYLSQGINSITHRGRMAYAYDLASSIGTPVYAMRSGKVISIRDKYPDTGGGELRASKFNYVLLEHDGGYRSVYVHLQQNFLESIPLKKGMTVEAGQLIGYSGNSGWSSGPHLHVEVQRPGSSSGFRKTVPFAVSGRCPASRIASNPSSDTR